jgi:hypothetical protein
MSVIGGNPMHGATSLTVREPAASSSDGEMGTDARETRRVSRR